MYRLIDSIKHITAVVSVYTFAVNWLLLRLIACNRYFRNSYDLMLSFYGYLLTFTVSASIEWNKIVLIIGEYAQKST